MGNTITLPHPADKIVNQFIDKIKSIEPKFIDGIYLTGSLSMNDFYYNKSDIDFLVFCKKLPDKKIATQLKHIHKTISRHYHKPDLSGCYLASESIKTEDPEKIKILSYHENSMRYGTFEMAPISLSELKYNAFTILGVKAEALPFNIKPGDVRKFLHKNINSYWTNWIRQHSTFVERKIMLWLFPRLTEWSVLGVSRQLCTLETGKIVSKTEAGFYCLEHLPEKFHSIVQEAIEIRKDNKTYPFLRSYTISPSFKRMTQTIECVNYIISLFNKSYNEKRKK